MPEFRFLEKCEPGAFQPCKMQNRWKDRQIDGEMIDEYIFCTKSPRYIMVDSPDLFNVLVTIFFFPQSSAPNIITDEKTNIYFFLSLDMWAEMYKAERKAH